jgi:hypothetical protein
MECNCDHLDLPLPAASVRSDGLWQQTCFEAFIGAAAYCEFNFSPSSQWAAYDFASYRADMRERATDKAPEVGLDASQGHFALEASFDVGGLSGRMGLSAVIEELDGTKSYWALAHPPGAPDFHHPACFAAALPAPAAP